MLLIQQSSDTSHCSCITKKLRNLLLCQMLLRASRLQFIFLHAEFPHRTLHETSEHRLGSAEDRFFSGCFARVANLARIYLVTRLSRFETGTGTPLLDRSHLAETISDDRLQSLLEERAHAWCYRYSFGEMRFSLGNRMQRIVADGFLAATLIALTAHAIAAPTAGTPSPAIAPVTSRDSSSECNALATQWEIVEAASPLNAKLINAMKKALRAEVNCSSKMNTKRRTGASQYRAALKLLGVKPKT